MGRTCSQDNKTLQYQTYFPASIRTLRIPADPGKRTRMLVFSLLFLLPGSVAFLHTWEAKHFLILLRMMNWLDRNVWQETYYSSYRAFLGRIGKAAQSWDAFTGAGSHENDFRLLPSWGCHSIIPSGLCSKLTWLLVSARSTKNIIFFLFQNIHVASNIYWTYVLRDA